MTMLESLPPLALNAFWVSQMLIAVAALLDISSWQFKRRENILAIFVVSNLFIAGHYFLLDHYATAALITIGATRFGISIYTTAHYWIYIYWSVAVIATIIFYQIPLDILALLGSLIITYAGFRKTDKALRILMMFGTLAWVIYAMLIFSPAMAMLSGVFFVSNLFPLGGMNSHLWVENPVASARL